MQRESDESKCYIILIQGAIEAEALHCLEDRADTLVVASVGAATMYRLARMLQSLPFMDVPHVNEVVQERGSIDNLFPSVVAAMCELGVQELDECFLTTKVREKRGALGWLLRVSRLTHDEPACRPLVTVVIAAPCTYIATALRHHFFRSFHYLRHALQEGHLAPGEGYIEAAWVATLEKLAVHPPKGCQSSDSSMYALAAQLLQEALEVYVTTMHSAFSGSYERALIDWQHSPCRFPRCRRFE